MTEKLGTASVPNESGKDADFRVESWDDEQMQDVLRKKNNLQGGSEMMSETKPDCYCTLQDLKNLTVLPYGWVMIRRSEGGVADLEDFEIKILGGTDPLAENAALIQKLDKKTKDFRAFREARIGHDYITHSELLEEENEALKKELGDERRKRLEQGMRKAYPSEIALDADTQESER